MLSADAHWTLVFHSSLDVAQIVSNIGADASREKIQLDSSPTLQEACVNIALLKFNYSTVYVFTLKKKKEEKLILTFAVCQVALRCFSFRRDHHSCFSLTPARSLIILMPAARLVFSFKGHDL